MKRSSQETKEYLASKAIKVAHNLPFDVTHLVRAGCNVVGRFHDTLIAHSVLEPDAYKLDLNSIAPIYLGPMRRWKHLGSPKTKPKLGKCKTWKRTFRCRDCHTEGTSGTGTGQERICENCNRINTGRDIQAWKQLGKTYNRMDAAVLPEIASRQRNELASKGQLELFDRMMLTYERALIPMQQAGIKVDKVARNAMLIELQNDEHRALAEWKAHPETRTVDPNSNAQLAALMYTRLGLPKHYGASGALTTDVEAINDITNALPGLDPAREILSVLLRIRRARKWAETYLNIGDRIYPRYSPGSKDNSAGGSRYSSTASTGRLIAKGDKGTRTSPLQQIPKPCRRVYIPDRGIFVQADYSSQELRLIAYLARDQVLIDEIESGADIHANNMTLFEIERVPAKNCFYGGVYGASARKIYRMLIANGYQIEMITVERFLAALKDKYKGVFTYHKRLLALAANNYYLENPFRRRRYFWNPSRSYNEILNTPVQSTGADILWSIILPVYELCAQFNGALRMLIHDSVVCDIPPEAVDAFVPRLREIMEQEFNQIAPGFRCPVDCEIGPNWGDLKPWKDTNVR